MATPVSRAYTEMLLARELDLLKQRMVELREESVGLQAANRARDETIHMLKDTVQEWKGKYEDVLRTSASVPRHQGGQSTIAVDTDDATPQRPIQAVAEEQPTPSPAGPRSGAERSTRHKQLQAYIAELERDRASLLQQLTGRNDRSEVSGATLGPAPAPALCACATAPSSRPHSPHCCHFKLGP